MIKHLRPLSICIAILFLVSSVVFAETSIVTFVKTNNGNWKLTVDDKDYFIKGMAYSADKIGERPDANEWMWEDSNYNGRADGPYNAWVDLNGDGFQDISEKTVGDFALLKAMGVNTIRIYHAEKINKDLLRDLYYTYGIRVIMGNYLGAYTKGSGAHWDVGTDYTNQEQRIKMKESVRKMVLEHKDEPYVLMWMLGNENDSGGSQANSTKTNTNAVGNPEAFAKFVNEAAILIKSIDQNHPVGVCNATTKFLPYYKKFSPALDFLGFNQYSGPYGFGSLFNRVKTDNDLPVLISEFGCDAYNSKLKREDERFQSKYHIGAWRDIEKNSAYNDAGAGNAVGGVVYCWLDKWWLVGSAKVHDTELGSWAGPKNDNTFHDEWFGMSSQGNGKHSPFERRLRDVYYVYQEVLWKNDITK
ncbi:glycoside hydrolase family 2 TIM barrel-domain containing protein [Endomicrobium proavitum]|uniref:Glycoside hydrolase family 2 catalytic domain-containing protein n=1 Tax=Endomicrobium proavitum TaxID=1408281 RepID=A0A0G3WJF6_9BACT|nr:glycoside hydrolase family 2 TIM barrel-domain containing protein [Endomicrobium proavitum]AKL98000.1 conserved exported protein of unknown function [Endomicrobium proavitum]